MTENTLGPNERPTNEWPVRIGGLMRCCTQALADDTAPAGEGTPFECPHCHNGMVLRDGHWLWVGL